MGEAALKHDPKVQRFSFGTFLHIPLAPDILLASLEEIKHLGAGAVEVINMAFKALIDIAGKRVLEAAAIVTHRFYNHSSPPPPNRQ